MLFFSLIFDCKIGHDIGTWDLNRFDMEVPVGGLALLSHFAVAKVYYVILDDIGTILFRIWAPTPKIPREHNDCLAFETARFQHCFQSCDTYHCINH